MRNTNKSKFTPMYFVGALICFTAFSGLLLSASHIYADNNTSGIANVSVNVPAICSLTVDPDEHAIDITPGNAATIGYSDIKAVCNDPAGLAVYAVGYTNDTYGNNDFVATVNNNTYTIPSDNVANPTTSQWNMILSPIAGDYVPTIANSFDTAHAVPTTYTKVAYRNTATDLGDNATGANFRATFNVYVDHTQAAGTYTAKVKFLLVHPNVLTYDDQTGEPDTVQPTTLPTTFDMAYEGANKTKVNGYYALQDMTSTICNAVDIGQIGTLIDTRDNQTYTVRKLKMTADGSQSACWMSNLNLGAQAFASGVTQLDSTNTHLASGVSPITTTTFNSWYVLPSIWSGIPLITNPTMFHITSSNIPAGSDTDPYDNKYGTLYSYAAASAGTYAYDNDGPGTDATSDLCPAGWRLPKGMHSNFDESKAVIESYNIYDFDQHQWNTGGFISIQRDLGFANSGFYYNDEDASYPSGYPSGLFSLYWASSADSNENMDDLNISSSHVSSESVYRGTGAAVRCIAQ